MCFWLLINVEQAELKHDGFPLDLWAWPPSLPQCLGADQLYGSGMLTSERVSLPTAFCSAGGPRPHSKRGMCSDSFLCSPGDGPRGPVNISENPLDALNFSLFFNSNIKGTKYSFSTKRETFYRAFADITSFLLWCQSLSLSWGEGTRSKVSK